jgi:hypothetical protein
MNVVNKVLIHNIVYSEKTPVFLALHSMEQQAFKKYKQMFEYQHLLLLRDIWWSKF